MKTYPELDRLLSQLRKEYRFGTLDLPDLDEDPVAQFVKWFEEAVKAPVSRPDAMALATAGKSGKPALRTVLLKGVDEKGFLFFTSYQSQKAKELEENPFATLMFYWPELERQVTVAGQVEKISVKESQAYFKTRPRSAQLGAWAAQQSQPAADRDEIEKKYKEAEKNFEGKEVPCPPFWGGYRVWPVRFEFWQGRESRLNDRFKYERRSASDWDIVRLQS